MPKIRAQASICPRTTLACAGLRLRQNFEPISVKKSTILVDDFVHKFQYAGTDIIPVGKRLRAGLGDMRHIKPSGQGMTLEADEA